MFRFFCPCFQKKFTIEKMSFYSKDYEPSNAYKNYNTISFKKRKNRNRDNLTSSKKNNVK